MAHSEGGVVHALPEDVINRIAAGEVIQRPSSALKELIENAIDAKCTSIHISLLEGGMKRLDIVDNGCGVWLEDLPKLCLRFTTSKLKHLSDLEKMETFGFRGEALASISLVSHVTIQSRRNECNVGYCCQYEDTRPLGPPTPCACNVGTHITYEDLFYNMPTRYRALRNMTEEYARCLEIVQQYAIQYAYVSFSCRKINSPIADIHTVGMDGRENRLRDTAGKLTEGEAPTDFVTIDSSFASIGANTMALSPQHLPLEISKNIIEKLYGKSLAKELMEIYVSKRSPISFECRGLLSNTNYAVKKGAFILFINGRLVSSTNLQRAVKEVYVDLLPRGNKPWIFLSIYFPPDRIDVNVHPTKKEVKFLYEEDIIVLISDAIRLQLEAHSSSRSFDSFQGSTLLLSNTSRLLHPKPASALKDTAMIKSDEMAFLREEGNGLMSPLYCTATSGSPQYRNPIKIRTDARQSSLHSFVIPSTDSNSNEIVPKRSYPSFNYALTHRCASKSESYRLSIQRLLALTQSQSDATVTKEIVESVFVGVVNHSFVLLQHHKKLLLVNLPVIVKECIYQSLLHQLQELPYFTLNEGNPPSLHNLLLLAIQLKGSGWDPEGKHCNMTMKDLAMKLADTLQHMAPFLAEYFSLMVEDGWVKTLPSCCGTYFPGPEFVPTLCLRLAAQVNWDNELECFDGICRILADCFSTVPYAAETSPNNFNPLIGQNTPQKQAIQPYQHSDGEDIHQYGFKKHQKQVETLGANNSAMTGSPAATDTKSIHHIFEHFFFPAISYKQEGIITELTSLDRLYRIFERC